MKTLFWRYFLTQWVAIAILVSLAIVLTALVAAQRVNGLDGLRPEVLVETAREIARREGEEGLKRWVQRTAGNQTALTIYLLRPDNTDVLGQTVHPRLLYSLDLEKSRDAPFSPPDTDKSPPSWWELQKLTLPDGSHLVLVFLPFDNSQWDMLHLSHVPITLLSATLLVTFLLCWWMTLHVTAPIGALTQATRRLAAGQLDARAPRHAGLRNDALGQLARDFDTMADRIQHQVRVREQLLRHIAHELRSPLTRLQIAVELAGRRDDRLPVQLARIVRESDRLETLLQHTLELARMSELSASTAPVDLVDVIGEVVEDVRFEHPEAADRIDWQPPNQPLCVIGDRTSLRSAIDNVVRNAVRYGASDKPVRIALLAQPGQAEITIVDGGKGVAPEELQRIFEPFQRGSAHSHQEGSGLGLSIARACVQAHGGTIEAGPSPAGDGFQVRLTIPLERAPH